MCQLLPVKTTFKRVSPVVVLVAALEQFPELVARTIQASPGVRIKILRHFLKVLGKYELIGSQHGETRLPEH